MIIIIVSVGVDYPLNYGTIEAAAKEKMNIENYSWSMKRDWKDSMAVNENSLNSYSYLFSLLPFNRK